MPPFAGIFGVNRVISPEFPLSALDVAERRFLPSKSLIHTNIHKIHFDQRSIPSTTYESSRPVSASGTGSLCAIMEIEGGSSFLRIPCWKTQHRTEMSGSSIVKLFIFNKPISKCRTKMSGTPVFNDQSRLRPSKPETGGLAYYGWNGESPDSGWRIGGSRRGGGARPRRLGS
jgi:hypothetical protein